MSPLGSEWIQSSHKRYVRRREHSVPANFKAAGGQFFWDRILHDRGWVPGCELCLILTILLEEIGIDFGLAPVVGRAFVVMVDRVRIPGDARLGILMLMDTAKGMTKLMQNHP